MCAGCAMAAAAGVTGARAFLQAHGIFGRRGRRLATAGLLAVGLAVSTIGLSGSGVPDTPPRTQDTATLSAR